MFSGTSDLQKKVETTPPLRVTVKLSGESTSRLVKLMSGVNPIDRDAAARLGITVSQIDNTLYDAFGQRQVSTIYVARNQYHVIMEVAPRFWQNPETLKDVYVSTSGASVGGSQATNAVAGTVSAPGTSAVANSANAHQASASSGASSAARRAQR